MNPSQFHIPRFLASLALFHDLAPHEVEQLARGCQVNAFERGDMIFHQGQPCDEFHVVINGQIKLFAVSFTGQEKVIELLGPGASFAEALMFAGMPYVVSAQALADSWVLRVGKAAVLAQIEGEPRYALRMLAGLSRRLHGLVHDVQAQALHNGRQRVIGYLLGTQATEGGDSPPSGAVQVSLRYSKSAIASRLSLTPEYFSRVLRELEDHGLIQMDKRDIHIPDPARLVAFGAQ